MTQPFLPKLRASEVTGQVFLSTHFAHRHPGGLEGGTNVNHTHRTRSPELVFYQEKQDRCINNRRKRVVRWAVWEFQIASRVGQHS